MSGLTSEKWWKAALDTLLWLLDPQPEKAEKAYVDLFNRLVRYFSYRGRTDAEDLAEETITRLAKDAYVRLTGFLEKDLWLTGIPDVPRTISAEAYASEQERIYRGAYGFAKNVLREHDREDAIKKKGSPDIELADAKVESAAAEKRHELLEHALTRLTPEDRRLIEGFYNIGADSNQRSRRDLAKVLGLTANALRSKAIRIRQKIRAEMTASEGRADAQFTAYYPLSATLNAWSTVLAYMHVSNALSQVQSDSRRRLSKSGEAVGSMTATKNVAIARGTKILVVPQSEGLEFNPPQVGFLWLENLHCAEFRCRARSTGEGAGLRHAAVRIAFYVAPILIAEIPLTIAVGKVSEQKRRAASVTARPYQRVFVSYSHNDSDIANQLEKAYAALGIEYLRDVRMLRSGEKWAPALLQRIEESQIFQLLWSKAAKRSRYVRQEWQHALSLHRSFFIRPVYWDNPMPPPPRELADIHFAYLELRGKHL